MLQAEAPVKSVHQVSDQFLFCLSRFSQIYINPTFWEPLEGKGTLQVNGFFKLVAQALTRLLYLAVSFTYTL